MLKDIDPKKITKEHRFYATKQEKEIHDWRLDNGVPSHVAPFSCLIACMGNNWVEGCQEAVYEMYEFTNNQGYLCTYYEQPDLCYQPYDAIGTMRNVAYRKAILEGFEYILYVDNDVAPPKDALAKLMHRLVPVIMPRPQYWDGNAHHITAARMEANKGLAMIQSTVISFVLFRTAVFLDYMAADFWDNAIGADEAYHFQKLRGKGINPFVDTDVSVKIMKPPSFPLDNKPTYQKARQVLGLQVGPR